MADVIQEKGQTQDKRTFEAEGGVSYTYVYRVGPEGSIEVRFSYSAESGSADDPGGFNGDLLSKCMTSFTVQWTNDDPGI
jgi:hypothetical protein